MKRKTTFIATTIVVLAAAGAVWIWKPSEEVPQTQASTPASVDDQAGADAKDDRVMDPAPQTSERTFDLPPSDATGSYKPTVD